MASQSKVISSLQFPGLDPFEADREAVHKNQHRHDNIYE